MSDELEAAERLGYSRGYASGRRKRLTEQSVEADKQRNAERFDRFMAAAITGLIVCGGWRRGDKVDKTAADFADSAAGIARELMKKAPR